MDKSRNRMFIDQYGQRFYARTVKDLAQQLCRSRAARLYRDKVDGTTVHVGYVIGQHWLTEYAVVERAV